METLEHFIPDDDRPERVLQGIHNPRAPLTDEELETDIEELREILANPKGDHHV